MNTDLSLDKPKPHDEEAEKLFLGTVLDAYKKGLSARTIKGVTECHIGPENFYKPIHADICRALMAMKMKNMLFSQDTVFDYMVDCMHIDYEHVNLRETLQAIENRIVPDNDLSDAISRLKEKYRRREIIRICTCTIQRCYDEGNDVDIANETIKDIRCIYFGDRANLPQIGEVEKEKSLRLKEIRKQLEMLDREGLNYRIISLLCDDFCNVVAQRESDKKEAPQQVLELIRLYCIALSEQAEDFRALVDEKIKKLIKEMNE